MGKLVMNRARQLRIERRGHRSRVATAEAAGIAYDTLRKIEEGEPVTSEPLMKLAELYKVPADTLQGPPIEAEAA
jgi:transcriptional regulator with XRE-family HTH domain